MIERAYPGQAVSLARHRGEQRRGVLARRRSASARLRRRGLALRLHFRGVVAHQVLRDGARRELPLRDFGHRRHLGRGAGDEAFREIRQLVRHDPALDHLDAALLRQHDRGGARDAGEEAVGDRRVDLAVLDEEDVGAGAFGDAALPVEHHGVGIAFALGAMLGDGADHVEAGGLGEARRGRGIGTAVFGEVEPDALEPLRRVEIARPFPGRDGEMDFVLLRRDAQLLRAAPGDGAHVGVFLIVAVEHQPLGGVDLGHRIGNFEVEDVGRALQPLGMLGALVDRAAIGALALEHAACVVQPVGQHADLGVRRGHELAVEPDQVRDVGRMAPPWHFLQKHEPGPKPDWPAVCGLLPLLLRASSPDMLRPNHQSAPAGSVQCRPF